MMWVHTRDKLKISNNSLKGRFVVFCCFASLLLALSNQFSYHLNNDGELKIKIFPINIHLITYSFSQYPACLWSPTPPIWPFATCQVSAVMYFGGQNFYLLIFIVFVFIFFLWFWCLNVWMVVWTLFCCFAGTAFPKI